MSSKPEATCRSWIVQIRLFLAETAINGYQWLFAGSLRKLVGMLSGPEAL